MHLLILRFLQNDLLGRLFNLITIFIIRLLPLVHFDRTLRHRRYTHLLDLESARAIHLGELEIQQL